MNGPAHEPAGAPRDVAYEHHGIRIADGVLHIEAQETSVALGDIVMVRATSPRKSIAEIVAAVFGGLLLLAVVPSAMMCPLALMGIPVATKILSWALSNGHKPLVVRIEVRAREPLSVRFEEGEKGAPFVQALEKAVGAR